MPSPPARAHTLGAVALSVAMAIEVPSHADADEPRAHAFALGSVDTVAQNVAPEIGASVAVTHTLDLGASALLGDHTGARLRLSWHPHARHRLAPYLAVGSVLLPLPESTAFGASLGAGATLELGPGRLIASVQGDAYDAPAAYYAYALFVGLGYEVDLFHTSTSSQSHTTSVPGPSTTDSVPSRTTGPATLHVTIVDDTGAPVPATLWLQDESGEDRDGVLSTGADLTLALPIGATVVMVDAPGHLMQGRLIRATRGQTVELRIEVRKAPSPSTITIDSADELKVASGLTFLPDQPSLAEDSLARLDEVADYLLRNPRVELLIEGHATDGRDPTDLSEARAFGVLSYLVSRGVPASRMRAEGVGNREGRIGVRLIVLAR